MAELLLISILKEAGLKAKVHSAGVSAWGMSPASENAVAAMRKQKLDLSSHTSSQLTVEILAEANLTLTMTSGHLQIVQALYPQANAFTLCQYADKKGDVSDPFGGDLETYIKCATQIKELIEKSITKLKEELWKV